MSCCYVDRELKEHEGATLRTETRDLWFGFMQCPPSGSAMDQAWEHTQEPAIAPAAPGVPPSPEEHKPGPELILYVSEQNNIRRVINISYRDGTLASLPKHLLCVGGAQPNIHGKEGDAIMLEEFSRFSFHVSDVSQNVTGTVCTLI